MYFPGKLGSILTLLPKGEGSCDRPLQDRRLTSAGNLERFRTTNKNGGQAMQIGTAFTYLTGILLGSILVGGCATMVPDHTLYLGEVAHIATKDEILRGVRLGPDAVAPPTRYQEQCISDSNNKSSFILVRYSYFWTRAGGDVHNDVSWAIVPNGLALNQGNIVELDIARSKVSPNFQCPTVTSIRFLDFNSGACEYRVNQRGVGGTLVDLSQALIGGRGSRSIYCQGLAEAGWKNLPDGPEKSRVWKKNFE